MIIMFTASRRMLKELKIENLVRSFTRLTKTFRCAIGACLSIERWR